MMNAHRPTSPQLAIPGIGFPQHIGRSFNKVSTLDPCEEQTRERGDGKETLQRTEPRSGGWRILLHRSPRSKSPATALGEASLFENGVRDLTRTAEPAPARCASLLLQAPCFMTAGGRSPRKHDASDLSTTSRILRTFCDDHHSFIYAPVPNL